MDVLLLVRVSVGLFPNKLEPEPKVGALVVVVPNPGVLLPNKFYRGTQIKKLDKHTYSS